MADCWINSSLSKHWFRKACVWSWQTQVCEASMHKPGITNHEIYQIHFQYTINDRRKFVFEKGSSENLKSRAARERSFELRILRSNKWAIPTTMSIMDLGSPRWLRGFNTKDLRSWVKKNDQQGYLSPAGIISLVSATVGDLLSHWGATWMRIIKRYYHLVTIWGS